MQFPNNFFKHIILVYLITEKISATNIEGNNEVFSCVDTNLSQNPEKDFNTVEDDLKMKTDSVKQPQSGIQFDVQETEINPSLNKI
ncbi:hypothetical protein GVAV_002373 [Gurleya vavrai]